MTAADLAILLTGVRNIIFEPAARATRARRPEPTHGALPHADRQPRASRTAYPHALRRVMNIASADESGAWLSHWPLVGNLRTHARARCRISPHGWRRVRQREGRVVPLAAGSFKALGAPIALVRLVKRLRRTQDLDPQRLVTAATRNWPT